MGLNPGFHTCKAGALKPNLKPPQLFFFFFSKLQTLIILFISISALKGNNSLKHINLHVTTTTIVKALLQHLVDIQIFNS
jgi:hypothetical protein